MTVRSACAAADGETVAPKNVTVALPDAYPVAAARVFVCPRRHVGELFELEERAWAAPWALARDVRRLLDCEADNGWNV